MAVSKTKVEAWLDRTDPPFSLVTTFFPDLADGSCSKPCSSSRKTSIKKRGMPFCNPFLKQEEEEERKPSHQPIFSLPQLPLSLALTLSESVDGRCSRPSRKTTIKHCDFGLLCNVVLGIISAYITTHLLSWNVHWAQKNDVYNKFRSYVTAVTQFFRTSSRTCRIGKQSVSRAKMDWQNLPVEMCTEIGIRSTSKIGVLQFRSVCKKWRAALGRPILFPLQVPRLPSCKDLWKGVVLWVNEVNCYHKLGGFGFFGDTGPNYLWQIKYGFPVLQEWPSGSNRCRYSIGTTDADKRSFIWPEELFMGSRLENPLYELVFGTATHLISVEIPRSASGVRTQIRPSDESLKMVIISSPEAEAKGVNSNYIRVGHLSAVVLLWDLRCPLETESMKGRLALLRLGGGDKWDTGFCSQYFVSITVWRGRLCAMKGSGIVYVMDYDSLRMTRVCGPMDSGEGFYSKQLFEYDGGLYAMDISEFGTKGMLSKTYKLDFEGGRWVHSTAEIDFEGGRRKGIAKIYGQWGLNFPPYI